MRHPDGRSSLAAFDPAAPYLFPAIACALTAAACGAGGAGGLSQPAPPAPAMALLAGNADGLGSVDGPGASARFFDPVGVAADAAGNVYVADSANNTIRRIARSGLVTTLAGTAGAAGYADGNGAAAHFDAPYGLAVDPAGNVFVADWGNNVIRQITPAGVVTTLAGTAGVTGHADGTGAAASFAGPTGIAVDSGGTLYVSDTFNSTIRRITPAGVVTTFAGTAGTGGYADGTGAAARFNFPAGVAADRSGNLYVADEGNSTIRLITPAGAVSTLAGTAGAAGHADGTGAAAAFDSPFGIAADSAGNLYVGDVSDETIRRITPAAVVTTIAGTAGMVGSSDGTGAAARFASPFGVAVDGAGNAYVADRNNMAIRRISGAGAVSTWAGRAVAVGHADGTGGAASFFFPFGVATDSTGNVYVADRDNDTIRQVTPAGVVTTLAGAADAPGSADGTGAAARFFNPFGVATDGAGNLYVSDTDNNTVRKIAPGGVVTTLAGNPASAGHADGTGAAATFDGPAGLATDLAGNVYVADSRNDTIRRIAASGVVTTLAGSAGVAGSADGTGAAAGFNGPTGIATDGVGNIYVADSLNNTIRWIAPSGAVSTLAGSAGTVGSADGAGAAARFNHPSFIAWRATGDVYVVDQGNSTIRKITPQGNATTVIGQANKAGFAPGGLPGTVSYPNGIAFYFNNLYFAQNGGLVQVTNAP